MELEKRLEKWDALFEELKEVVESFIPSIEKSINDALSKMVAIEQRVQKLETEVESIKKNMSLISRDTDEDELKHELDRFEKEIEDQVRSLQKEINVLKESVNKTLVKTWYEFNSKLESVRKSAVDTTVRTSDAEIKRIEKEIDSLKETIGKIYRDVEQIKANAVERHRIIKEKKVEGRSPRIL